MTVLPVIVRELRASARQPFTYTIRLLGVVVLLLASSGFLVVIGVRQDVGLRLFQTLHCTLLAAIWVLVPLLTADCISRERREGTLGLLFLTPLKGTEVVIAKSLIHGLRALTLGLAVLPVLTLPFLVGGVGWGEAALALVLTANAMCWALAAGLLASTWCKSWTRAIMASAALSGAACLVSAMLAGAFLLHAIPASPTLSLRRDTEGLLEAGFALYSNLSQDLAGSSYFLRLPTGRLRWVLGQTSFFSLLALVASVLIAGAKLRRSWREEPPSARRLWWQRTFCTPVLWLTFFRRWMRRKLERNPIGWLEQRTWSGRLVTWGWIAVLFTVYSAVLPSRFAYDGSDDLHAFLALFLVASMAASAAGSFRRERETGVLELLLVSPLRQNEIILGRLKGLWSQFTPGAAVLALVWAYCATFEARHAGLAAFCLFLSTCLTMPVFGLYASLCWRNFLTAFLSTIGVGLLLPVAVVELVAANLPQHMIDRSLRWYSLVPLAGVACQLVLCPIIWYLLYRRLQQRSFPLERSQTG